MNLIDWIKKRFFKPKYLRLEMKFCTYEEADKLIRGTAHKPEEEQRWVIAVPEEDGNTTPGWVYLERRMKL